MTYYLIIKYGSEKGVVLRKTDSLPILKSTVKKLRGLGFKVKVAEETKL